MKHKQLFKAVYEVKLMSSMKHEHKVNVVGDTVRVNIEFSSQATAHEYCNQLASLISRKYKGGFYISTSYFFADSSQPFKRYYENIKSLKSNIIVKGHRAPEIDINEPSQRNQERPHRSLILTFRDDNESIIHSKYIKKDIFSPEILKQNKLNDFNPFANNFLEGIKRLNEELNKHIDNDKIDS